MTIGDVLAMIAAFVLTATAWGAMILFTDLLFPARSCKAEESLTTRPWACLARGVGVVVIITVITLITLNTGAGPVRLLAGAAVGYGGLLSAVGSAGIVRLTASRLAVSMNAAKLPANEDNMLTFALLLRSTALYILTGLLPIVGWLFVTPIFLLLSIGAGSAALLGRNKTQVVTGPAPVPTMEMGL
jgi:hypothetical protein